MKHNGGFHTCMGEVERVKQKLSSSDSVHLASCTGGENAKCK